MTIKQIHQGLNVFRMLSPLCAAALLVLIVSAWPVQAVDNLTVLEKSNIIHNIADKVRDAYVDSINVDVLYDGAIQGMIDKLDPHSSYMPPSTADDFDERIRGTFQGIGISFIMMNKKITIIEVIENGPSQRVGLMTHDRIVRIDGKNAIGISENEVKERLRGPAGTTVTVQIERPGIQEQLTFTITRDKVEMDSVSHAYMLDAVTGYISLVRFSIATPSDMEKALQKLGNKGMKRLVLDLRNNAGGSLEAAVGVANLFIKNGVIVSTKGRKGDNNSVWKASGTARFANLPIIVMVNHGSASASEIVAGALQDHDRAIIVGQTTFGKGLVMRPFQLKQQNGKELGTLVLTVAKYYTPTGRLIQRPYDGDKDEYIKEGFDDYDPNAVEESKEGKPVFFTDLKREVYGGGGITPDKILKPLMILNDLERELRKTNLFFEYVDTFLMQDSSIPEQFETFLDTFHFPETEYTRFRNFITEKNIAVDAYSPFRDELKKLTRKYGIPDENCQSFEKDLAAKGIDLNDVMFRQSEDFIERELKQEVARVRWGSEARYRVWHSTDTELRDALAYFGESEDLMKHHLSLKGY